jgi:hypothetical protein
MCAVIPADGLRSIAAERMRRQVLSASWARTPHGQRLPLTDEERALVTDKPPIRLLAGHDPLPMLAVAQLYARDIPDFKGPAGTDLLQVLWCPLDHDELYCPAVALKWRRASEVTTR